MDEDQLADYWQRVTDAVEELETLADAVAREGEDVREHIRLKGKVEGLRLALYYLRVYGGEGGEDAPIDDL